MSYTLKQDQFSNYVAYLNQFLSILDSYLRLPLKARYIYLTVLILDCQTFNLQKVVFANIP